MTQHLPFTRFWAVNQRRDLSLQLTRIGFVLTLIFVAIAFLAPVLQAIGLLQDPYEFLSNPPHHPPSLDHWFGTTRLGYDVFSRTIFGSQAALKVVVLSTLLSLLIGVPLGMISGYLGGKLDRVLLFVMDTIYTLPGLLLSVTLAFVVGRGIVNAAIALSISYIPQYYRIVRNQTASIKNELYVEAAQALGASTWKVLSRYLFLNVIQSVPVILSLNAADAIATLGGLGFLGLGLPEEVPEWGQDLRQALDGLSTGGIWWTTLFPGLAMTLMIMGLSMLGEGLNALISPRSRVRSAETIR
ncbi:MAG TPA: ABC transporter permease [Leptolyngbyaceae cyanobacterium M33_DOE_097]|uniref:ABC transporter permease n=1 Tax=Oscillatoriales cyanobacterium SpSt-418 TaxID=2282169 RepID=A0A7C3KG38_9CYAN|nr:ABC transporter permease [Leptolyngbyaceae cyanobacterium M33_DOE_097]